LRKKVLALLIVAPFLKSCGRGQSGYIKNETGQSLIITLGLNDIKKDPTIYLYKDALNGNKSSDQESEGIDNYFVKYDSLTNELTLKLDVDEKLKLGTLRLDMSRDSIKDWEFHSLKAVGEGIKIEVEGQEIMKYVSASGKFLSQETHHLILK
jgi:hypothetical protein